MLVFGAGLLAGLAILGISALVVVGLWRTGVVSVTSAADEAPTPRPAYGLDGCCPVELCEQHRWVAGDERYSAMHLGRKYLFYGEEQRQMFLANRDRYSPLAAGDDVVLATEGIHVPGKREHGVFYDEPRLSVFQRGDAGTIQAATPIAFSRQSPRLEMENDNPSRWTKIAWSPRFFDASRHAHNVRTRRGVRLKSGILPPKRPQ